MKIYQCRDSDGDYPSMEIEAESMEDAAIKYGNAVRMEELDVSIYVDIQTPEGIFSFGAFKREAFRISRGCPYGWEWGA